MVIGRRRMSWQFKEKTPTWFYVLAGLLMADTAVHFGLSLMVSSWASPKRDALHMHPLPFRDGVVYFVGDALGWYLGAWWISVVLFAILVVLLVVNRAKLERTM